MGTARNSCSSCRLLAMAGEGGTRASRLNFLVADVRQQTFDLRLQISG